MCQKRLFLHIPYQMFSPYKQTLSGIIFLVLNLLGKSVTFFQAELGNREKTILIKKATTVYQFYFFLLILRIYDGKRTSCDLREYVFYFIFFLSICCSSLIFYMI